MTEIRKLKKQVKQVLKKERYEHTLGVMYTAAALAMRYDADMDKAMTAGLLHDCAKYCSCGEQIKLCKKYDLPLTEAELAIPALIHAKLGAYLAEHEYDITDREVLDAIAYHTTGRPHMTLLEKIIYLADLIEPGRDYIPVLPKIRSVAFVDLNNAVCMTAGETLKYLEQIGNPIDPATRETYNYYNFTEEA